MLLASVAEEYLYGVQEGAGIPVLERFTTISGILVFAFNVGMGIGFLITLFNLAFAFIMYTMSMGEPKNIKKAQNAALWSGAGMAIVIGAWTFKQIVLRTLGVTEGIIVDDPTF